MKKLLSILISCTLLFGLAACGSNSENQQPPNGQEQSDESRPVTSGAEGTGAKALVVYFSATGNTKSAAEGLAKMQGADLYEIVPKQPYTDEDLNYNDSSTRATVEQNDENARPAISGGIDNLAEYDVIYVGFPIWWGDMPRILYTFFDTYDLSDKTIAPFCTSGGSGISKAVQSINKLEPSATITEGLQASTSHTSDDFAEWLSRIGLAGQE